jgi:hypothetical protein
MVCVMSWLDNEAADDLRGDGDLPPPFDPLPCTEQVATSVL